MKNFTHVKIRNTTILILLIWSLGIFEGFGQTSNFLPISEVDESIQVDYKRFLDMQNDQLLNADFEIFTIGDKTWLRCFGEKEFYVSPRFNNRNEKLEYNRRISRYESS